MGVGGRDGTGREGGGHAGEQAKALSRRLAGSPVKLFASTATHSVIMGGSAGAPRGCTEEELHGRGPATCCSTIQGVAQSKGESMSKR